MRQARVKTRKAAQKRQTIPKGQTENPVSKRSGKVKKQAGTNFQITE